MWTIMYEHVFSMFVCGFVYMGILEKKLKHYVPDYLFCLFILFIFQLLLQYGSQDLYVYLWV